jgi:glycosyltransferase involved in cell wall biosynthesis
MKTLVDASAAFNQRAGIGRYGRNILARLIRLGAEDSWTFVDAPEIRRDDPGLFPEAKGPNVRTVRLPLSRRNADRLWFRLGVPLDIRLLAGRADVVFSPDFTAPPMAGVPRMVTIHDLAFLTHPETSTEPLRRYLEKVVPRQVEGADKVAVVSYATREVVIRLLNVPESKIVVARNAVDERFYEATLPDEETRQRLGLPEKYLLMLGTIEPRKNHVNALRALELAGLGEQVPLVIAGRPGWGFEPAMDRIRTLEARGIVRMLDYVPDDDLPTLIAGAAAMIYPSWTEGFGLPLAEALATGIPVVTGTDAALREVAGPYGLYAHPGDVETLSQHMRQVALTDTTNLERQQRREWTRQFSWDSSTSIVLQSLRQMSGMKK